MPIYIVLSHPIFRVGRVFRDHAEEQILGYYSIENVGDFLRTAVLELTKLSTDDFLVAKCSLNCFRKRRLQQLSGIDTFRTWIVTGSAAVDASV